MGLKNIGIFQEWKNSVMNPLPTKTDYDAKNAPKFQATDPVLEVIPPHPSRSFRWLDHDYPSEIAKWQYHPEIEIHLIRKSTGSMIVGDYIGPFEAGHVSIIGSNLPHDWMSDLQPGQVFQNRDAVIQFEPDWLAKAAAVIPELSSVKALLDRAQKGIVFHGNTRLKLVDQIEKVGASTGLGRVHSLFAVLETMAQAPHEDCQYLSRLWVKASASQDGKAAVEAGIKYIFENLTKDIRMSEAARIAHMSEPTFSKYFKKASGFTFSDMVRKLRIGHACRLLDQSDATISAICSSSGYTNLANFNRQFLAEMGMTPSTYRNLDADHKPETQTMSFGLRSPSPTP